MKRIWSGALFFWISAVVSAGANAVPEAVAWKLWDAAGSVNDVDHSAWQQVLDGYVVTGADGINRVRYAALREGEGRSLLKAYIGSLSSINPGTLTKRAQMAYWINLYNALTVDVVLQWPRKKSILRMGRKLLAIGPWDDAVVTVAGQPLTLNDIEHRILRPLFRDERVHFAVNCASLSCPNLAKTAYTTANLDALLDAQVRDYLGHPRGLQRTATGFELSSIFDWYRVDFAADETGLRDWLAARRPDLSDALRDPEASLDYDYDWGLNGAP